MEWANNHLSAFHEQGARHLESTEVLRRKALSAAVGFASATSNFLATTTLPFLLLRPPFASARELPAGLSHPHPHHRGPNGPHPIVMPQLPLPHGGPSVLHGAPKLGGGKEAGQMGVWLRRERRRHQHSPRSRRLHRALLRLAAKHEDNMRVGVCVVHVGSGEEVGVHEKQIFPLASVVKVPIMVEAARQLQRSQETGGSFTVDTLMELKEEEKCIGAGQLRKLPSGSMVTFGDCMELMQVVSDNTAADMVLQKVSLKSVQKMAREVGMNNTSIYLSQRQAYLIALGRCSLVRPMSSRLIADVWRKWTVRQRMAVAQKAEAENREVSILDFVAMECRAEKLQQAEGPRGYADDLAVAAAVDNEGSPRDSARLLAQLARGNLLSPRWTSFCLDILSKQKYGTRRLPRCLPKGTKIYHKTGTILGVVNNVGIIEVGSPNNRVAVAAFIDRIRRNHEREAEAVIARIGRLVYDAYNKP